MSDFGPSGALLWDEWHQAFEAVDPDELVLLRRACSVADRIAEIESQLGTTFTTAGSAGQIVAHPLLVELRLHESHLASLLGKFRLEDGWDGLSASERASRAAASRWKKAS